MTMHCEVCGCDIDPVMSAAANYAGETYYFCSEACEREFAERPQTHIGRGPVEPEA